MELDFLKFLPWVPLLGAALCAICAMRPSLRKLAGPISVLSIFAAFCMAIAGYLAGGWNEPGSRLLGAGIEGINGHIAHAFNWITVGDLSASFSYFIDPLTLIMLFVVCGIGTLVALYAMGYMHGDRGYARFFFGVSLFIFAMTTLVMADNLVLLFLGWEGVGLCSYLLIGYYYEKPSAVAAAKKAFIVNRVGDFGFALGIFLTWMTFDTVWIPEILDQAAHVAEPTTAMKWIPFLLMVGAFGKSAQFLLFVWLPDAMEGPTPVSALIHAATMVTAGVYLIARLFGLFELYEPALMTVAGVGALTAFFAATIALCQYDIKRIWAYSTVSQLGYMFLGLGAATTIGATYHLFTHAFFKALLFLTAGSVMHAMAGQLDLRKMSGLRHKMPVTCWLMFAGCLALAGFPFTSGFFSKDLILGYNLEAALTDRPFYWVVTLAGVLTAFITAFYTFRLWFRVFWGPEAYVMGVEAHAVEQLAPGHPHNAEEQAGEEPGHAPAPGHHAHEPHEMPFWPMNLPLVILALGALFAGAFGLVGGEHYGWFGAMIDESTAIAHHAALPAAGTHGPEIAEHAGEAAGHHEAPALFGVEVHRLMQIVSGSLAIIAIALAWYFHLINRAATDRIARAARPIVTVLARKYYVDEAYDRVIVRPLRLAGEIFLVIDEMIINNLVYAVAWMPRVLGYSVRPAQSGRLQGYGLGMVGGVALIVLVIFIYAASV
ncbi:MAG: NADH-quinone oxidoreductase subunit L [Phycisphaeraceae bacterium]